MHQLAVHCATTELTTLVLSTHSISTGFVSKASKINALPLKWRGYEIFYCILVNTIVFHMLTHKPLMLEISHDFDVCLKKDDQQNYDAHE